MDMNVVKGDRERDPVDLFPRTGLADKLWSHGQGSHAAAGPNSRMPSSVPVTATSEASTSPKRALLGLQLPAPGARGCLYPCRKMHRHLLQCLPGLVWPQVLLQWVAARASHSGDQSCYHQSFSPHHSPPTSPRPWLPPAPPRALQPPFSALPPHPSRKGEQKEGRMPELSGWSEEDVMPQSSLHRTEGLMCRNHRAGLVVTAPRLARLPAPLAAPALPARGCHGVGFFWNGSPRPRAKGEGSAGRRREREERGGVLPRPQTVPALSGGESGH